MAGNHLVTAYAYSKQGRLLAKATNNYKKTHPLQSHFARLAGRPEAIYLHAEIAVLLQCGNKHPYRLFVARYTKDGSAALAKPCKICQKAIKAFGVVQLSYTE